MTIFPLLEMANQSSIMLLVFGAGLGFFAGVVTVLFGRWMYLKGHAKGNRA